MSKNILKLATVFAKKAQDFEDEESEQSFKIKMPLGALNEDFYQWSGQGDPLYAIMSRANADGEDLEASEDELNRLADMAEQVLADDETGEESKEAAMDILDQLKGLGFMDEDLSGGSEEVFDFEQSTGEQ